MKSQARLSIATLAMVVVMSSMIATSVASAAGWRINGTSLGKGSKAALTTAATVDTATTLSIVTKSETVQIKCTGATLNGDQSRNHWDQRRDGKSLDFPGVCHNQTRNKMFARIINYFDESNKGVCDERLRGGRRSDIRAVIRRTVYRCPLQRKKYLCLRRTRAGQRCGPSKGADRANRRGTPGD